MDKNGYGGCRSDGVPVLLLWWNKNGVAFGKRVLSAQEIDSKALAYLKGFLEACAFREPTIRSYSWVYEDEWWWDVGWRQRNCRIWYFLSWKRRVSGWFLKERSSSLKHRLRRYYCFRQYQQPAQTGGSNLELEAKLVASLFCMQVSLEVTLLLQALRP